MSGQFTVALEDIAACRRGDRAALDRIYPLVYEELRRVARSHLSRERPGHTLQPTALVNEVYLRLCAQHDADWSSRAYVFGLAATMMRRILVNHARDSAAKKRGAGVTMLTLSDADGLAIVDAHDSVDVLAIHEALDALAQLDSRQARVVELKFFGGLEIDEIATLLEVSSATVRRDWTMAKLWLGRELAR
ncbi:MAG: sigma-70 family RNA polymerase sigma factor [Burkholderiales bacterium]|nr:sigma-70 family RNA polymerase sigma factor [Burkholderiales bacterium]